jgi:hypothetical protein
VWLGSCRIEWLRESSVRRGSGGATDVERGRGGEKKTRCLLKSSYVVYEKLA